MDTKILHIVLLPPEKEFQMAVATSKRLTDEHDVFFTLNNTNSLPHITLAQIEIASAKIEEEIQNIRPLLTDLKKINTSFIDAGSSHMGWVWLCTTFGPILHIHKRIVEAVSHGTVLTAEPFLPHLTITRLKNHGIEESIRAENTLRDICLPKGNLNLTINEAAIGFAGEHGVFEEIIQKVNLT